MIKAIEFPNKEFATKAELYKALHDSKDEIISLKKAQVYKSVEKDQVSVLSAAKAMKAVTSKNFEAKEDYIYPIISTTKYLDSHKDVHFDGCFTKTVKEQQGKVLYALDHELKYDSVIAWQKDVKMFVCSVDWAMVGKSYTGQTEALVFEIAKDSIKRKDVLESIENESADFENSIRMTYHKIRFAVNSNEKDFAEAKAYYDLRIGDIANKEAVEEDGYFWGVEELGIYKEGSLVVAGGSNDATSIYHKNIGAVNNDTPNPEPPKGTRKLIHYL